MNNNNISDCFYFKSESKPRNIEHKTTFMVLFWYFRSLTPPVPIDFNCMEKSSVNILLNLSLCVLQKKAHVKYFTFKVNIL